MPNKSFTLESLLETHEQPFIVIDASLTIVAVNRAWEIHFGISREQQIGQACCTDNSQCRHKKVFKRLEPYAGLFPNELSEQTSQIRVRGYPLLDENNIFYIGESITLPPITVQKYNQVQMIGTSVAFNHCKEKIEQAAQTRIPTMLLGETGTGKEVAATYLHQHSKRADGEFVIVDCTILSEDLFESELFGHEKGAFTGATTSKQGLFQLANKGTLFLDEIGELPLSLQPKLLRALESGQYRRVGSSSTQNADVRVIGATHRDLAEMVKLGTFREDLYYRLSVFPIHIPPLRERLQDIPVLADYLLQQISKMNGENYSLTRAALMKLIQHQWPGNIRELRNCLQMGAGLCASTIIEESDIHISEIQLATQSLETSYTLTPQTPEQVNSKSGDNLNLMEKMESEFITQLLKKYRGNRKLMANEMNISERTLYRKLKRLNLNNQAATV
jgi:transcriptional regulator with PAS, ATPase and Fis domain